ncbi:hypothetical protein H5410_044475 [Solanum commersonii]|uniref:Uncharacterized protein n=1 Tax=Solanum commersonii TaxID=4109 RepID=A0A9J5X6X6_SOLCO|nr:hypothetical protein H5410_044475 [Solanum commersonii]
MEVDRNKGYSLQMSSERNRNLQQSLRDRFKGCRQRENSKKEMESPLKFPLNDEEEPAQVIGEKRNLEQSLREM